MDFMAGLARPFLFASGNARLSAAKGRLTGMAALSFLAHLVDYCAHAQKTALTEEMPYV